MKHNLSSAVVMMLINEGFIQESDEDEADSCLGPQPLTLKSLREEMTKESAA